MQFKSRRLSQVNILNLDIKIEGEWGMLAMQTSQRMQIIMTTFLVVKGLTL